MTKIEELYKQFGFFYIIKSFIKRVISPIVKMNSFYILAIENHKSSPIPKSVRLINDENKSTFLKEKHVFPPAFLRQLATFIDKGTIALVVIIDNAIAGWGFVQNNGVYKFANYNYYIPEEISILKNLYIIPKQRGKSIGKIINEARLNIIEDGNIPLGFVIPSNKYALRNLEMYGFVKQVYVKDYLWLNKFHKRKIKRLRENSIAQTIEKGFKNGE